MMDDISKLLDEEYQRTLDEVSLAQTGTDEAKWQLEKLNALHKQRMDEQKSNLDEQKAISERKDIQKDRVIKIVLESLAILIPVGASCFWMAKGMEFETKGTYTSRTLNWVNNHFKFFRK